MHTENKVRKLLVDARRPSVIETSSPSSFVENVCSSCKIHGDKDDGNYQGVLNLLRGGHTRGVHAGYGTGTGVWGLTDPAHGGAGTVECSSCQSLSARVSCRKELQSCSFPLFLDVGRYQRLA